MAILNYAAKDVAYSYGGTNVTAMFEPKIDVERKALLQEFTPAGVAWKQWLDTGFREMAPFTLTGVEDFTAVTGSRAKVAEGTSGAWIVTYGGTKTTTVTCLVTSYKSTIASEKLHLFHVTFQPTGSVVEA